MACTVDKLLSIARAEIGYLEKASDSQLDNPTANAGSNNFTKYARDLFAANYYNGGKNGFAWCDVFVDWCFYMLADKDTKKAQEIIYQSGPLGAGCVYSAGYYKSAKRFFINNPKPGDQIFFGNYAHTGIVEAYDGHTVTTIEGNTSNRVARRYYKITDSYIDGFGRPKYDGDSGEVSVPEAPKPVDKPVDNMNEKEIWEYINSKVGNEFGTAGIIGNLYAESGLRPNNVQDCFEAQLRYDDKEYTMDVDNGTYRHFCDDAVGYGLAQWTYGSRKRALLNYAKSRHCSIADCRMQLDFLFKELSESYKSVLDNMKTAASVEAASDYFMCKFEAPRDQSMSAKRNRSRMAQVFFDRYAKTKPVSPTPDIPASKPPETCIKHEFHVGDIVSFVGTQHFRNSVAIKGIPTRPGRAKITSVSKAGRHKYHCISVGKDNVPNGLGVYGWVNECDVQEISLRPEAVIPDTSISSSPVVKPAPDYIPKVGDYVMFNGGYHYSNCGAKTGRQSTSGKAKITSISKIKNCAHPYHLVRTIGSNSNVYGWVDANSFDKI